MLWRMCPTHKERVTIYQSVVWLIFGIYFAPGEIRKNTPTICYRVMMALTHFKDPEKGTGQTLQMNWKKY